MCSFILPLPQSIEATATTREAVFTISVGLASGSAVTLASTFLAAQVKERTVEVPSNHSLLSFDREKLRGRAIWADALETANPLIAPAISTCSVSYTHLTLPTNRE